jgi:hypothetical protein
MGAQIPPPKEPSPEPTLPRNTEFALPCPHCIPGNPFGWKCVMYTPHCILFSSLKPAPVVQLPSQTRKRTKIMGGCWRMVHLPVMDSVDTGQYPAVSLCHLPGSVHCSENLLALRAPSTSRCDFCQVSFCGIGIPERCCATSLHFQHLNGFSDLGDLVQAADIYECFEGNTVEVEMLFDRLTEHRMTPKQIYQEVRVSHALCPLPPSKPCNPFHRLSNKFRTPLKNSLHCSTRISSLRFTGLPEVLIPTQQPLVRKSAGGVPLRFSCGVFVIGGSGREGRVAFRLLSLTSQIAPVGNLAEIRRIRVRTLSSMGAT